MKRYAYLLVALLLATGMTAMHAEEKSSSPFGDDISVTLEEKENDKKLEETAEVVTEKKEEKAEDKKDGDKKDDDKKDEKGDFPVTGTVQGDNLRLRQWPWGPVISKHMTGQTITVNGVSGEFYEVTVNGVKGYMHKNYVSIPGTPASGVAPYYPGDTRTGGFLSKDEGTKKSEDGASGKTPVSSGAAEGGDLANYPGGKLAPDKFIALFGPVAKASMKETGVPASVTLAQAILETGWGGSTIGDAKNLFGIKGTGPAGTTVVNTKECYDGKTYVTIKDGFRKYNTWQESIDDHAKLVSGGRYKSAWDNYQKTKDADAFARGIHQAGYATSPTYASTLISLMKQYNLYQWDN